ncbi:flagellar hook-length control protein FliK [Burkholderia plantarii]|uniref:flagellar hook-length control protein FliK n=1 Tax=Burkholderia plantarii TaxID=41899 RepID=UPI0018DE4EDE|nr:flagellar hook-length control protein FliK [Burkholderia plantarii]MBI0327037.1 flagellar hook-length control protein FliK [Burkholderia plantarii]
MTGIDAVTAAMLASRIDSLLEGGVSAGAAATQVGVSTGATRGATQAPLPPTPPGPPAASVQTDLSSVALTLDAISRYGGDATPVVIGSLPLLAGPPVLDPATQAAADAAAAAAAAGTAVPPPGAAQTGAPAGSAATASGAAGGPAPDTSASGTPASASAGSTAAASGAAPVLPGVTEASVAALAAALSRAVSGSGLFYESHLSQWLSGQRTTADLAQEPQTQLTRGAGTPASGDGSRPTAPPSGAPGQAPAQDARQAAPGQFGASGAHAYASFAADDAAGRLFAATAGQPDGTTPGQTGADASANTAAAMATVHPATLPLVRQQLDLLATEQFRWAGEAWPGARLDWSVEPDGGQGASAEAPLAWRTRLVLALPTLGTVDAELVLTGSQLVARLRANEAGAAKLNAQGDALRQRLQASGLELGGLSIRSVEIAPDAFDTAATRAAAAAYGQAAAAQRAGADAKPRVSSSGFDLGDFDDIDEFGLHDDGAWL